MLDQALEALKTYDWGTPLSTIAPIEDAVAAAHDKSPERQQIENRLIDALKSPLSRDARDYVCRKLAIVGSSASVPMLAVLLTKPDSSHMARFALERITAPEAASALRNVLPKVTGTVRIGVINSLGARRDAGAIKALRPLLKDRDAATVRAAALALGAIGTVESARELLSAGPAGVRLSFLTDALLNCAEALLADRNVPEATAIYLGLNVAQQPRLIRLAATRGLLACAGHQT